MSPDQNDPYFFWRHVDAERGGGDFGHAARRAQEAMCQQSQRGRRWRDPRDTTIDLVRQPDGSWAVVSP